MTARTRLAPALHRAAWTTGLSSRRARGLGVPRILMFHAVGGAAFRTEAFEHALSWIARRFQVVSLGRLVEQLAHADTAPDEVALTFDDGLHCHGAVAYPALRRLGIPATFFVCAGLADSGRWLWNHEARARLAALLDTERDALAREIDAPARTVEELIAWMKVLPPGRRTYVEEVLRACTPRFLPTDDQRAAHDVMGWDEIRGLDPEIVTIGSHGMNHAILPTLPDDALGEEIEGSRRALEARLDRPVEHFCYPNGAQDARVQAFVREHYRSAVTTVSGFPAPGGDAHALPRIPAEAPVAYLAWRLHRPHA